ncbi:MAG: competence protein ComEA [Bermanella sp.]|jgi:competence protein ComEA
MNISVLFRRFFLVAFLLSGFAFAAEQPSTVNINSADADTIAAVLKGAGRVRAQSIVQWRESHGPFTSAEQLVDVSGVGAVVLEKNREKIVLE